MRLRFRIALSCVVAAVLVIPAGASGAPFEPNDTLVTAAGPLVGGQDIVGAMETANDQDWFKMYTAPGSQQVEIALTDTAPSDCFGQYVRLTKSDGSVIDGPVAQNQNMTVKIQQTLEGSSTYYVQVEPYAINPCIGSTATYRLRVEPASVLVSQLPANPPAATPTDTKKQAEHRASCERARSAVSRARASLRSAQSRLGRARTLRARRAARRGLRRARARLNEAVTGRTYQCQTVRFPGDAPLLSGSP